MGIGLLLLKLGMGIGVPQRFAKLAGGAIAVLVLIALVVGGYQLWKHSVIRTHDLEVNERVARQTRKADADTATERRVDDNRLNTEETALKEAREHARTQSPNDRRIARQRCIRLQQQARAAGNPAPACQ